MKKNLFILLIVSCVLFMGCMEDKRPSTAVNRTETVDTVKTQKKDTVAQVPDTSTVMKEGTDTVCASTKPEEPIQVQTIQKDDNSTPVWCFIALTLGIASFLLVLVLWYRSSLMYKNLCHDMDYIEHEADKNVADIYKKIMEIQKEHTDNNLKLQACYKDIEKAIDTIGKRIVHKSAVNDYNKKEIGDSTDKNGKAMKQPLRTGYFGVVKTGNGLAMFNDYPKSRNDDAYFEMTYLDDTHCEFAPFDLNRMRAIDDISSAVDYTGSMAYAKRMKVLSMGKAEYNSERDFWRITDRVKIELLN